MTASPRNSSSTTEIKTAAPKVVPRLRWPRLRWLRRLCPRPAVFLALALLVYVPLFWTSGGQRQLFYDTLLRGYLLIP
ncbi:MAG: hypothetical protein ACKOUR_07505, partial [Planctomycetota bacterium]